MNKLKPKNDDITGYLLCWIESLDGDGLIITDDELIQEQIDRAKSVNFKGLRKLIAERSNGNLRSSHGLVR